VNQGFPNGQSPAISPVRQAIPCRGVRATLLCLLVWLPIVGRARAASAQALPSSAIASSQASQSQAAPQSAPLRITLQDAIARARKLSPTLATALANARVAADAAVQARAAVLPNVNGVSQYLYTEGNGTLAARFIANNGVHEYIAQADVHQALSGPLLFQYRRAGLLKAVANDQAMIAERGLLVTVVQAYSTLYGAQGKLTTAQDTLTAARNFLTITEERQKNGDAAFADVLKARIQAADAESAVNNAQLLLDQSRVALALLIFEDVNQPYQLADDPSQVLSLPPREEAQALAATSNPELESAENNAKAAGKDLTAARLGYLPSLSFDYYYGIDANQFATEFTLPNGRTAQNLGYSALGSLTVPIFTWGSTWSKVRDAKSLNQAAQTNLGYARRKAVGDFQLFYQEAQVASHDLEVRQQAYDDAVQSGKLTLLQYRAGDATALEVVTAESAVDTESAALYDAKTRFATAIANLATLTGRL
jgi:outer membrane protein TolC